jgi:BMFP domain-containing protein YqiC
MSTGPNRILDEFAKMMTDAAGAAQGVRREVEGAFRAQGEKFLNNMDLVKREEFDAVMEMAANARAHNDTLEGKLALLEARIVALEGGVTDSPAATPKKAPAKATKTK